jgi:hypothetical protein
MSIRAVKRIAQAQPTMEGAGVHLRRAFGFGDPSEFDPFLLLMILGMNDRRIILQDSHGIRTGGSRLSRTCLQEMSHTATVWGTTARLAPAMFNG